MIVFPLSIQCALSTGSTLTVCMLSAYGLFPWLRPVCLWRERENPADATSPPFTPSFVKLPPGAAAKNVSILSALHEGQHMNPALMEKDPTACVILHERKKWWESRFVFGVDRKEDQTVGKATPLALTLTQQSVNELVGLVWHLGGGYVCRYRSRCRRNWCNFIFRDHFGVWETSETSGGIQTRRLQAEGGLLLGNLPRFIRLYMD